MERLAPHKMHMYVDADEGFFSATNYEDEPFFSAAESRHDEHREGDDEFLGPIDLDGEEL